MGNKKINLFSALKRVALVVMLLATIASCSKVVEPTINDLGYEFYPMQLGDYRIYFTQTVAYNLDGTIDTVKYLVKEIAEDSVLFADGNYKIILGRYSSDLTNIKWQKDSIWAVLVNASNVILSEANVDFVKLSFPVKEDKEWDGNAANAKEVEMYKLLDVGKLYDYDTLSFENTLTVVHKDLLDPAKITEDDYRIEVFAANVGLVHKLNLKINYCSNCVENGKIDDGFIFEQKLIEFGQE